MPALPNAVDDAARLAVYPFATRLHPQPIPSVGLCDEPRICISLNSSWASHVQGALETLRYTDAWQGTPEQIYEAIQQIERLQDMLSTPCEDSETIITNDAVWDTRLDTVLNAYDGTPHSLDRDAPDTDFVSDPDDTGSDAIDRIAALCWSCRLFIAALCKAESDRRAGANTMASIIGGVLSIPLLFLAPTGTPFLVISIVRLIIQGGAALFTGISDAILQNAGAQEAVACCMYNFLAVQTSNTRAVFEASLSSCAFGGATPEEALRGAINPLLSNADAYFAFLKQLGESLRYERADLLDTCPCDEWSHVYLSVPNERPPFDLVALGSFDAANVWYVDEKQPAQTRMSIQVNFCLPVPTTITRLKATFTTLVNSPFSPRNSRIYNYDCVVTGDVLVEVQTTNSGTYTLDTGEIDLDTLGFIVELFARHVNNPADYIHFTSLEIHGRGFDPFA